MTQEHISVTAPLLTTALTLGVIGAVVIASLRRVADVEMLDRGTTESLRGLGIIGVVLVHLYYSANTDPGTVPLLSVWGQCGVAVFLFLSGFGLTRSGYLDRIRSEDASVVGRWVFAGLVTVAACVGTVGIARAEWALAFLGLVVVLIILAPRLGARSCGAFLVRRFWRIYPLVATVGAVNFALGTLAGSEELSVRRFIGYVLGLNEWYVKTAAVWYMLFVLSALLTRSRTLSVAIQWLAGVAVGAVLVANGALYFGMWVIAFPAGCTLALEAVHSRVSGRSRLGVVTAATALAVLLSVPLALALWGDFEVYRGVLIPLGSWYGRDLAGVGPAVSFAVRLTPSVGAIVCAVALAYLLRHLRLQSRLLGWLGGLSLAIYLLNFAMITKYDPVLWRGPVVWTQWILYALLIAGAWALHQADAWAQARIEAVLPSVRGIEPEGGSATARDGRSSAAPAWCAGRVRRGR